MLYICLYCPTSTSLASHVSCTDFTRLMWGMLRWRSEQAWHTNTPKVSDVQSGSAGERAGGRGRAVKEWDKERWHRENKRGGERRGCEFGGRERERERERKGRKWNWAKWCRRMIERDRVEIKEEVWERLVIKAAQQGEQQLKVQAINTESADASAVRSKVNEANITRNFGWVCCCS